METAVAEKSENPFAHHPVAARPSQENAMVAVEQSRAIAETQAAMVIAKKFPRNQVEAMDRILQACARPTLAEDAMYEYSRGGSAITGPSIRLAEALAQNWGNIQFGIRELEQRNGESTVEAFAWDVETNTRQVKTFQVPHKRHTKSGSYALTDPRDVYEMVANQGARRLRACILGIIPGDVIDAAVHQCEVTLKAKMDITPEFIQSVVDAFARHHVTKDMLEKRIQRRMDTLTPALAMNLKKILNSLKDGMSTPADWFEMTQAEEQQAPQAGVAGAKEAVKARRAAAEKQPAQPVQQPKPADDALTIKDALALVNKGDYPMATDIASRLGDNAVAEVAAAIKKHQGGEKV